MDIFTRRKPCFTFTWAIENASALQFVKCLASPEFSVKSVERTRWHLEISFDDDDDDSSINLSLTRECEDDVPPTLNIYYEFSFLGGNGLPLIMKRGAKSLASGCGHASQLSRRQEVFVLRKAEFLPKDVLTVRCRMWMKKTEGWCPDVCFASTRMGIARHYFVWPIKGFSLLQAEEDRKRVISVSEGGPKLILSVCLTDSGDKRHIRLKIGGEGELGAIRVVGEIAVLNAKSAAVDSVKIHTLLLGSQQSDYFIDTQKLLGDKSTILTKDTLYLRYDLEIFHGELWSRVESCEESDSPELEATEMCSSHPQKSLTTTCPFRWTINGFFRVGTLSDVTLRAGSESFPAHKLILGSRSPVFKAMFTRDMSEKSSKCVDLSDLDADTLLRLLSYIYTNTLPEVEWQVAADLFQAADKYELLELKKKCATILKLGISRSNVCNVLCLADMHRDEELLNSVLDFMSENSAIFKSESWKLFKENNSKLAIETMEKVVLQGEKSSPMNRMRIT